MQSLRGCVGFSAPKKPGIIGRAIQYFTHGKWTHTFVVIGGENDIGAQLVIEAGKFEVLITPLKKYLDGTYDLKFYEPVTDSLFVDAAILKTLGLTEKVYGYFQFLGFIPIWIIRKLTGKRTANPIRGGVICSELSFVFVKAINNDPILVKGINKDSIDPVYLEKLLARSDRWKTKTIN
jgi:hypothetical protein